VVVSRVEASEAESPELELALPVPASKEAVSESLILGWFLGFPLVPGYYC
jgi:hypothetical protein